MEKTLFVASCYPTNTFRLIKFLKSQARKEKLHLDIAVPRSQKTYFTPIRPILAPDIKEGTKFYFVDLFKFIRLIRKKKYDQIIVAFTGEGFHILKFVGLFYPCQDKKTINEKKEIFDFKDLKSWYKYVSWRRSQAPYYPITILNSILPRRMLLKIEKRVGFSILQLLIYPYRLLFFGLKFIYLGAYFLLHFRKFFYFLKQ